MKKITQIIICTLFVLTVYGNTMAQTCIATATMANSSFWTTPSTWGGTNPANCTDFEIPVGTIVTVPPNPDIVVTGTITVFGTLRIRTNGVLDLGTTGVLALQSGSSLLALGTNSGATILSGSMSFIGETAFGNIASNGYLQNGSLPIELLSFIGKRVGETIELQWKTATETNNALMEVERSRDGINFEKIGAEKARGDGNSLELQTYHFIDGEPLPGANYYRLRQIDKDNKDEYHKIITVLFTDAKGDDIKVFPTIVREELNIALSKETETSGNLYIHNIAGQLVWRGTFERGMQQRTLPLQELANGPYFITVQAGATLQTARFVKM